MPHTTHLLATHFRRRLSADARAQLQGQNKGSQKPYNLEEPGGGSLRWPHSPPCVHFIMALTHLRGLGASASCPPSAVLHRWPPKHCCLPQAVLFPGISPFTPHTLTLVSSTVCVAFVITCPSCFPLNSSTENHRDMCPSWHCLYAK